MVQLRFEVAPFLLLLLKNQLNIGVTLDKIKNTIYNVRVERTFVRSTLIFTEVFNDKSRIQN